MADEAPSPEVIAQLAAWFRRNGYVRRQNPDRLATEGYMEYKKGEEKSFNFLVGQAMKKLKGKGSPQLINKVLKERLG